MTTLAQVEHDGFGSGGPSPPDALTLPPPQQEHVAEYVADLAAELARLARSARLDLVAHLLEMARLEAEAAVGDAAPSAPDS